MQIGKHFFSNECISHGIDSTPELQKGEFGVLFARFKSLGYLAFSSFFPEQCIKPLHDDVLDVAGGPNVKTFEANIFSGFGNKDKAARWINLGKEQSVQTLFKNPKLQHTIKSILDFDRGLIVDKEISFQLAWVRGKGTGDGTGVHIDYYHISQPEDQPRFSFVSTDDILEEQDFKSFNVWTRLSEAADSSFLAVVPGSHVMEFDEAAKRAGRSYPDELEEKMQSQQIRWHILDGDLGKRGVLVLMSLRLAHGATINTGKATRFSFDARFRVPILDEREIVFGVAPAPHWATCRKWDRKCNHEHLVHMKPYVFLMLCINARLRREGMPFLWPELMNLVFIELCRMVTPRFRLKRNTLSRQRTNVFGMLNRARTGVFPIHQPPNDLDFEGTGDELDEEFTGISE